MNKIPLTGDGYLSVGDLIAYGPPYIWICGGRGIGKTFGGLEYVRYGTPTKFLLMRRTQQQIDLLRKSAFNPFKPVDALHDSLTAVKSDGKLALFYAGNVVDGNVEPVGPVLGYACALSTIHNVRGVDLSDVDLLIYDEFIPEAHERPIKAEYDALLNALETIGRNRELQGRPPLKMIAFSNSNKLGNPYFIGLGIMRQVDKMLKQRRPIWEDTDRGLMVCILPDSPISRKKADTALYRLAGDDSAFGRMSLGNEFVGDECSNPGTAPLAELRPVAAIGELCFYEHKHTKNLYCNDHKSGSPVYYAPDETNLKRARRDLWWIWEAYLDKEVFFLDAFCEIMFKKYFGWL